MRARSLGRAARPPTPARARSVDALEAMRARRTARLSEESSRFARSACAALTASITETFAGPCLTEHVALLAGRGDLDEAADLVGLFAGEFMREVAAEFDARVTELAEAHTRSVATLGGAGDGLVARRAL